MMIGQGTEENICKSGATSGVRLHLYTALIGAALFSCESWALGPSSWIYTYGCGTDQVPVFLALSHGDRNFSLWAPFVGGGLPRLVILGGNDPVGPEMLLFSTLPTWLANGLHRYLQYFLAIFFTARVCREQFSLKPGWSALAGWLHAAFSYFTVGQLLTLCGVPVLAWILDRLIQPRRGILAAVLGGLGFSLFATFILSVPYLIVFAVLWLLIVRRTYTWHAVRQFVVFSGAFFLAECPTLLVAMSCAAQSHRAGWPPPPIPFTIDGLFHRQLQFDMFAHSPILTWITMNLPGLAILLGLPLIFLTRWRHPDQKPFCTVTLRVVLLFGLISQRWLLLVLQKVAGTVFPWFMGFYMGRFFEVPAAFLIACSLTLTCYLLWQLLPASRLLRAPAVAIAVGFITFMIIWPKVELFYPLGVDDWGEKNYQIAALDDIRKRETEPFRVVSVLPLQPCFAFAQGVECADGYGNLHPAVYRDLWLRVLAPLFKNLPQVKNIFDPDQGKPQDNYIFLGADLMTPNIGALPGEDPWQCLKDGFDLNGRFNLDILRLLNVKYVLSEYPLKSPDLMLVHAPLELPTFPQSRCHANGLAQWRFPPRTPPKRGFLGKYRAAWTDLQKANERKAKGKDIFIYKLLGSLPRYRFVQQVVVEPDGKAVLDRLTSLSREMLSNRAVIQAEDKSFLAGRGHFYPGSARLLRYSPDQIELEIHNSGPGFLVIANTWDPHWRAEVDGKPCDLFRVNHAQFGLVTEPGASNIKLFFAPPYSPRQILSQLKAILP